MKLKPRIKRLRVKLRSHLKGREEAQIRRLHEQKNKSKREAARQTQLAQAREEANEAREELRKAKARKQTAVGKKKSQKAMNAFMSALRAIDKYANRGTKKSVKKGTKKKK